MYEVAWPCKNTKVDVDFWGYLWTFPITIRWDVQHPSNNTCVEQWYYNVDYPVNNDRCNIDGALNHVDGNINMNNCDHQHCGAFNRLCYSFVEARVTIARMIWVTCLGIFGIIWVVVTVKDASTPSMLEGSQLTWIVILSASVSIKCTCTIWPAMRKSKI